MKILSVTYPISISERCLLRTELIPLQQWLILSYLVVTVFLVGCSENLWLNIVRLLAYMSIMRAFHSVSKLRKRGMRTFYSLWNQYPSIIQIKKIKDAMVLTNFWEAQMKKKRRGKKKAGRRGKTLWQFVTYVPILWPWSNLLRLFIYINYGIILKAVFVPISFLTTILNKLSSYHFLFSAFLSQRH